MMTKDDKMYIATMGIMKNLLQKGIINENDYRTAEKILQKKYTSPLGALLMDMDLIKLRNRAYI